MSALIYSPTSALIEGTYEGIKNIDQSMNPVYRSIAFTGDGFVYTHGRKFRLFTVNNDVVQGLSFQIQDGLAGLYLDGTALGTGQVVQSITGDGVVNATTANGVVTISHSTTLNQSSTYGSATQIPIITVNQTGHITAIQNSGTIDVSKIRANATSTVGSYYPIGVTDNTLQNPLYNSNLFFDENGNIYATNFYIGNSALSTLFAPVSHTSVYATGSTYGHVKLSDSPNVLYDTNEHIAATPKAVSAGIETANQYAQDLFAAQDAMVFVGTLLADGTITSHNAVILPTAVDNTTNISSLNYKVGWTFRFTQAGTFNGEDIEIGDMLIAVKEKTSDFNLDDWTVIQTNISGALTATSNLNGLLYANNSRVVNALALSSGILKYDGTSLSFVNPNTLWRDIQIDSSSIGTNVLNLVAGNAVSITETNGQVTIGVSATNIIQSTAPLTIEQGQVSFVYKPNASATLTIGSKLTLEQDENENYILKHSLGTAFTNKLGSITTDNYGHVTGITEVSSLQNPYSLTIKTNNSTALEYIGSTAKTLVFKDGGDVEFTNTTENGNIIIQAAVSHKYRAVQFYSNLDASEATPLLANNVNTILTLVGGANVSLSKIAPNGDDLPAGTIMINAEDTWRNIEAYRFQSNVLNRASIGSQQLNFSSDFIISNNELGITWTEIDENGSITYVR